MKHINNLANYGKNKDVLIIGGGYSIKDFPYEKLPKYLYIVSCNKHMKDIADMIIYYDKDINNYYKNNKVANEVILIGYWNGKVNYTNQRCDYYYNQTDAFYDNSIGDTGFHSLRFCDELFNFENIYLLGFDYYIEGPSYHGDEEESETQKIKNFKIHSIGRVLPYYKKHTWKHKIYNCSKKSKVKCFPYGLPFEQYKKK